MAEARFVMYIDTAGEYRWRLRAPNGEIIADSAEGYAGPYSCKAGIQAVRTYAPDATLVDTTS